MSGAVKDLRNGGYSYFSKPQTPILQVQKLSLKGRTDFLML